MSVKKFNTCNLHKLLNLYTDYFRKAGACLTTP